MTRLFPVNIKRVTGGGGGPAGLSDTVAVALGLPETNPAMAEAVRLATTVAESIPSQQETVKADIRGPGDVPTYVITPTPVDFTGSATIKVFCPSGMVVSAWGFRRPTP